MFKRERMCWDSPFSFMTLKSCSIFLWSIKLYIVYKCMVLDFLGFFVFALRKCFLGLLFPLTCELDRVAHPNSSLEALTSQMPALRCRTYQKVMRAERGRGWVLAPGTAALTPRETPRPRPLRVLLEARAREDPASQGQHSHQNLKVPASSSGFLASRKQPVVKPLVTGICYGSPSRLICPLIHILFSWYSVPASFSLVYNFVWEERFGELVWGTS